jgi:hypothetical protein
MERSEDYQFESELQQMVAEAREMNARTKRIAEECDAAIKKEAEDRKANPPKPHEPLDTSLRWYEIVGTLTLIITSVVLTKLFS